MLKVENIEVWGFKHAVRGMRNPLNSWDKSDSGIKPIMEDLNNDYKLDFVIGPEDLKLMKKLYKAGTDHRKYLRQIFVSMDITAPLYWWKEFDTYKVGTVANSCSTMHKIMDKAFTVSDFSFETAIEVVGMVEIEKRVELLNMIRNFYLDLSEDNSTYATKRKKELFKAIIELLDSSYMQKRTITMNYENAINMINSRSNHKLTEWSEDFIPKMRQLPYLKEIMA